MTHAERPQRDQPPRKYITQVLAIGGQLVDGDGGKEAGGDAGCGYDSVAVRFRRLRHHYGHFLMKRS